jgi:Mrp family chromosome partitioning ATPase/capsular polysaccharide biosynthesis protein
MDFRDLLRTVTRHWVVGLLVGSFVLLLGMAAAFLPEKTYSATATLVLDLADNTDADLSVQQINFLLPALQQSAQSASLRDAAGERVPEELQQPRPAIEAVVDASVMEITASGVSPAAVESWANAVSNELIAERSGVGPLELELLDPAVASQSPVAPSSRPILLASMVVAFIAAVFATLAADRIRQAFDTRHAVRERLGTTILGEIPKFGRFERKLPIVKLFRDGSGASNEVFTAFETIRINVEFRLLDSPDAPISIISLDRHAGKTTVAAGMCCAMAKVGRDVVAIEADLRRPTLAEQLGTPRRHGLGDLFAAGDNDIVLQPTSYATLKVLTAGLPVGRAADVIGSTLPRVLDALEMPGRTRVVDSPPLRGAPESSIVVSKAPHVILVVGHDQTDLDTLSEAVARINEAGGALLGIVINRVPRRKVRKDAYPEFSERRQRRPEVEIPQPQITTKVEGLPGPDVRSDDLPSTVK